MTIRSTVLIASLLFASPAYPQDILGSTFDADADGWSASGGILSYVSENGNPGGFIEFMDNEDGAGVFIAPSGYLGDLSSYTHGSIKFDLVNTYDNGNAMLWGYGRVRISSPLHFAERTVVPQSVISAWAAFEIPLDASEWGLSESAWDSLLSQVTEISIQADAQWDYSDRVGLDNFSIVPSTTDIDESLKSPLSFQLGQNYPNPFNPSTTISYRLPVKARVTITVHDILGERRAVLLDQERGPGTHFLEWDASSFPSGVYFYRLTAGSFNDMRRMLLIR